MHHLAKLLVGSGLVILASPFCLTAYGQDQGRGYIDLEAERAAREAAGIGPKVDTSDPFGAAPTPAYPATTYGVNPAQQPGAVGGLGPNPAANTAVTGGTTSNLSNLFFQIQQLQQEVMRLNGKVEEQGHELRRLKEQTLQRYVDLDKRLSEGGGASAAPRAGETLGSGSSTTNANPVVPVTGSWSGSNGTATAQPGEKAAYDTAYSLVVGRQFEQAASAYSKFLRDFPGGKYAANAHYWLGELYLVMDPPDLEASRQSFALLLSEYPNNPKAPDALFKLGKVQFMKGNREKAREYLDLVVRQYESSNSSVTKLARDFIAENY